LEFRGGGVEPQPRYATGWQNAALAKLLRDPLEHSGYSLYRQTEQRDHTVNVVMFGLDLRTNNDYFLVQI